MTALRSRLKMIRNVKNIINMFKPKDLTGLEIGYSRKILSAVFEWKEFLESAIYVEENSEGN